MGEAADDPSSGHFGLQGMRERVDKLGGVLSIESAPGKGTTVSVTVPVRRPARAHAVAQVTG
jgi:signal transduction histidine kinase